MFCKNPLSRSCASSNHMCTSTAKHGCGSNEVSFRSQPAHKRHKSSASATSPTRMPAQIPSIQPAATGEDTSAQATTLASSTNPRKRRASDNASSPQRGPTSASLTNEASAASSSGPAITPETATKKKGRTNTPWTPEEEQKLQQMRGENKGWSEIAKVIRTSTARSRRRGR